MKKYLITGFSGFVSFHFLSYLENNKIFSQILGIDIIEPYFNFSGFKYVKFRFEKINLLDKDSIENIIFQFQPDCILHLASYSSVAYSWQEPVSSFQNNTNICLSLIRICY